MGKKSRSGSGEVGLKMFIFFYADPGSEIFLSLDPGWEISDTGSEIRSRIYYIDQKCR
jgi:hypothetical protein